MKRFHLGILLAFLLAWTGVAFGQTLYFDSVKSAQVGSSCSKDSIVLMSHNTLKIGKAKSDKEIAEMVKLYRDADIVVLQEVVVGDAGAQTVAERLIGGLNRTGAKWDYVISDPTDNSENKERYAYLWNTKRISYKLVNGEKINLWKTLTGKMARIPATVTFEIKSKDRLKTVLVDVVNMHLAPTDKHPEEEIKKFYGVRNTYFNNPNQIVVGDFNLSYKKLNPVFEGQLKFKHNIEGKTSLKLKKPKVLIRKNYLSKDYDNIFTKGAMNVCQAGIIDFVPMIGDLKVARGISDHLPVIVIFNI